MACCDANGMAGRGGGRLLGGGGQRCQGRLLNSCFDIASVAVGFDHDGPEYFAKTFLKSEGLSGGRRKLG